MDEWHEISAIDTGGVVWNVYVNPRGYFRATHPQYGEVLSDRYEDLELRARRATSIGRVKVSVPYAYAQRHKDGWRVEVGEATGIHGGTGNVLLRDGGGKTGQSAYGEHNYFQPPTPEQRKRMCDLLDEQDAVTKELKELRDSLRFPGGLQAVVQAAVDKARAIAGRAGGDA